MSRIRCNLRVFWSFFVHPGSDLCMQHTRMCFKLIHRPRRNGYRRQPKLFVYPITMTPTEKLTGLLLWRTKRLVIVCLLSWTQFLLTLSPHHSKVLINSTITANMTFTKTSPKFGQWSDHRANTVLTTVAISSWSVDQFETHARVLHTQVAPWMNEKRPEHS